MEKRRTNISQIWSKSLSSVKDRDLKLLAKGECTSLSLDLLNKQLSTISINITVIISFCMVYKCLCNPNSKQDSTPLMQKKKINDVAMWQSQRYVFIVSSALFFSISSFWFLEAVSNLVGLSCLISDSSSKVWQLTPNNRFFDVYMNSM